MRGAFPDGEPDAFSSYHPALLLVYFCGVLFFCMFLTHPVPLILAFAAELCYSVRLNGGRAVRFQLLGLLPVSLAVALLNPLLNRAGNTVLFSSFGGPVTLESLSFGAVYALAFAAAVTAFSCFNRVMTSERLMFLFGRLSPVFSLMFSLTLRFVPRYQAQARRLAEAQKGVGLDPTHGTVRERIRNGAELVSALITWALENAVESADSMKARGFGLKGRTSFSVFVWRKRDRALLAAELVSLAIVLFGLLTGKFHSEYIPVIAIAGLNGSSLPFYAACALFCFLPVLANVREIVIWNRLKSAD
jgi:energy-coupling factor transport system permease protein